MIRDFSLCRSQGILIPGPKIMTVKFAVYVVSFAVDLNQATWDNKLLNALEFISKSVLQVPFLLMTLMGYLTPTLDEM